MRPELVVKRRHPAAVAGENWKGGVAEEERAGAQDEAREGPLFERWRTADVVYRRGWFCIEASGCERGVFFFWEWRMALKTTITPAIRFGASDLLQYSPKYSLSICREFQSSFSYRSEGVSHGTCGSRSLLSPANMRFDRILFVLYLCCSRKKA